MNLNQVILNLTAIVVLMLRKEIGNGIEKNENR